MLVWIAFCTLIAVALLGNAIVMWIIVRTRAMHHSFNYFLFNMALADFLMALLNTGTTWSFNLYYEWSFGATLCHLNSYFGVAPTCISVFTMMVVSRDRCVSLPFFTNVSGFLHPARLVGGLFNPSHFYYFVFMRAFISVAIRIEY